MCKPVPPASKAARQKDFEEKQKKFKEEKEEFEKKVKEAKQKHEEKKAKNEAKRAALKERFNEKVADGNVRGAERANEKREKRGLPPVEIDEETTARAQELLDSLTCENDAETGKLVCKTADGVDIKEKVKTNSKSRLPEN